MLIVDSSSLDPYKNSEEYFEKSIDINFKHEGTIYNKKITYEKPIDMMGRIGTAALAILAKFVPYNSQMAEKFWQQTIDGVVRQVVLIKERPPIKVKFGENVQVRIFDKEEAPDDIPKIKFKTFELGRALSNQSLIEGGDTKTQ